MIIEDVAKASDEACGNFGTPVALERTGQGLASLLGVPRGVGGALREPLPVAPHVQASEWSVAHAGVPMCQVIFHMNITMSTSARSAGVPRGRRASEGDGAHADWRGPFWGIGLKRDVPGLPRKKPSGWEENLPPNLRHADWEVRRLPEPGIPEEVWKLSGAGSVGRQALLGIADLEGLRRRAVAEIWPFQTLGEGRAHVLAEMYPSRIEPEPGSEVNDARQVRTWAAAFQMVDSEGDLPGTGRPRARWRQRYGRRRLQSWEWMTQRRFSACRQAVRFENPYNGAAWRGLRSIQRCLVQYSRRCGPSPSGNLTFDPGHTSSQGSTRTVPASIAATPRSISTFQSASASGSDGPSRRLFERAACSVPDSQEGRMTWSAPTRTIVSMRRVLDELVGPLGGQPPCRSSMMQA